MPANPHESADGKQVATPIAQTDASSRLLEQTERPRIGDSGGGIGQGAGQTDSRVALLKTENATEFAGKHLAALRDGSTTPEQAEQLWTKIGHIQNYSERTLPQITQQIADLNVRTSKVHESVNYDLNGTLQPITFTDNSRQV